MKHVRLVALALFVVLMSIVLVAPLSAAAAPAHTSTSTITSASPFTGIPVHGTVKNKAGQTVGTFSGTLTVTRFAARHGHLVALGKLSGTLTNNAGKVIGTITNKSVAMPAAFADPPLCTILTLVLGPIHLNVLGLVVDVSMITITITGQPGLLGNLLCQLAGATTLQQIIALLNQILALLGV